MSSSNLSRCSETYVTSRRIPAAQKKILGLLESLRHGTLVLRDPAGERYTFGTRGEKPHVEVTVHDSKFFEAVLAGGSLALGESYMDGSWDVGDDNLVDFFNLLFLNRFPYRMMGGVSLKFRMFLYRLLHDPRSLTNAKEDIHRHYDLGNRFFGAMLDGSMAYSCGCRRSENDTLDQMQEEKYAKICRKLGLDRGGKIIDIGCGWGGMLIYAARHFKNLKGVGITLSEEQRRYAVAAAARAGLSDRLEFVLRDYREENGTYDFLISVGMFEHVGSSSYKVFFEKARELLNDRGLGLLHTIGLEEDPAIPPDPWTIKYIFPGSRLPRLEELVKESRQAGLAIGTVENLRPHYAATLRRWHQNFVMSWNEIKLMGKMFDRRFYRMWRYYLQMCEACFTDSTMELYHILFSRQGKWNFPMNFEL